MLHKSPDSVLYLITDLHESKHEQNTKQKLAGYQKQAKQHTQV